MSTAIAILDLEALRAVVADEVRTQLVPIEALIRDALGAHQGPGQSEFLTREEVAAMLRIDLRTLRRLVLTNELPAPIPLGPRAVRWRRKDLERHLQFGATA